MRIRPELLTHPTIPRPLHGLNPRTLRGDAWWREQRQRAYAVNDNRCWVCGVPAAQAKYRQSLEAHETYRIDYAKGRAEMAEIVALCHACHNFIHAERLWYLYQAGKVNAAKIKDVLTHGLSILEKAGLQPQAKTMRIALSLQAVDPRVIQSVLAMQGYQDSPQEAPWEDWRLVMDGKEYPSLYADHTEWERYYFADDQEIADMP